MKNKIPLTKLLDKNFNEFWEKIDYDLPHILQHEEDSFANWFDHASKYDCEDLEGELLLYPFEFVKYLYDYGFEFSNNYFPKTT